MFLKRSREGEVSRNREVRDRPGYDGGVAEVAGGTMPKVPLSTSETARVDISGEG